MLFAEVLSRAELIVRATAQGDISNGVASRVDPGVDVIELDEIARVAAPSIGRRKGAAAPVTLPDGSPDCSGNMT